MQPRDTGGGGGLAAMQTSLDKQVIQLRETDCNFERGACLPLPFPEIAGEEVHYVTTMPERGLLALSNYRAVLRQHGRLYHIPLGLIDTIKAFNDLSLVAMCKDGKSYWFKFFSAEHSTTWLERLQLAVLPPGCLEKSFAYKFYTQIKDYYPELHRTFVGNQLTGLPSYEDTYEQRADKLFHMEVVRQKFDTSGAWRITTINHDYSLCGSYPRKLVIPSCVTEANLLVAAQHRASKRIPAVVYRHQSNGAVLVRCSQPTVGLWYWRNGHDEDFLRAIAEACDYDVPPVKTKSLPKASSCAASANTESGVKAGKDAIVLPHPLYNQNMDSSEELEFENGCLETSNESDACFDTDDALKDNTAERFQKKEIVVNRNPTTNDVVTQDDEQSSGKQKATNKADVDAGDQSEPPGTRTPTSDIQSLYHLPEVRPQKDTKKVLFTDARSYTNAMANRARGGGFEYSEYYNRSDIQFMNLDNIHTVRNMHQTLANIVANLPDTSSWLSAIEGSGWLCYMSKLLKSAVIVCRAIAVEGRPVVVHCSDGWDRTPQITALAQLMLDPYYRTLEGFEILVEREWVEFGHKFSDRCGSGSGGTAAATERCPVFLQWLDAVHQLLHQFPQAFQFNQAYLVKLSQHIYSNLFASFLCNTSQDRAKNKLQERTYPVWAIFNINSHRYINYFYSPTKQVLIPTYHAKDLKLWDAVYRSTTSVATNELYSQSVSTQPSTQNPHPEPNMDDISPGDLVKTRSCDDVSQQPQQTLVRHSSDSNLRDSAPNLAMLSSALGSEMLNNSESIEMAALDNGSLRQSPDLIACTDTDDTDVDKIDKKFNLTGSEDTLDKLIPVCRCIEIEEMKRSRCDCKVFSVAPCSAQTVSISATSVKYSSFPTEVKGIPEASKKRSEVASEIYKGNIEKAVEANENGIVNLDETDDELEHLSNSINDLKSEHRMMKSDSDISELLSNTLGEGSCNGGQAVVSGSTDTLVYEGNVCDYNSNGVELSNCSLHMHHHSSADVRGGCDDKHHHIVHHNTATSAGCMLDEEIVENLMRKKLHQSRYDRCCDQRLVSSTCGAATSNCSVCLQSSKLITDLDSIVNSSSNITFDSRRDGNTVDSEFTMSSLATSTVFTTSVLGRFLPSNGNPAGFNGVFNGVATGSNGSSASNSRVASSKSTPGHSRTPSVGFLPHAADEERNVYSRSSSSSDSTGGGGGGWGGVDGVGDVSDNVQTMVHQLLSKHQAEVESLREHLALTQRALQQQLQHTAHCNSVAQQHCTTPVWEHDQHGDGSTCSSNVSESSSWEAVMEDSISPAMATVEGIPFTRAASKPLWPECGTVTPGVTIMGRVPTLWVPDHTANHCHACHAKFWVGLRRHHCRSCGGVFCSHCSGQSAAVPHEHFYQPVRVCRQCYTTLNGSSTTTTTVTASVSASVETTTLSKSNSVMVKNQSVEVGTKCSLPSSGCSETVTPTNTPRNVYSSSLPIYATYDVTRNPAAARVKTIDLATKCSNAAGSLSARTGCRGSCSKVN